MLKTAHTLFGARLETNDCTSFPKTNEFPPLMCGRNYDWASESKLVLCSEITGSECTCSSGNRAHVTAYGTYLAMVQLETLFWDRAWWLTVSQINDPFFLFAGTPKWAELNGALLSREAPIVRGW